MKNGKFGCLGILVIGIFSWVTVGLILFLLGIIFGFYRGC